MRGLADSPGSATPTGSMPPLPPPEVVSTSVALLVECALACGAQEVEGIVVCLEHAAQVRGDLSAFVC